LRLLEPLAGSAGVFFPAADFVSLAFEAASFSF